MLRALKVGLAIVASFLGMMVTMLILMSGEHRTALELPAPTGNFAVGRTLYYWTNAAKTDELAPVAGSKREVVVWIWYPAAVSNEPPAEYVLDSWRAALQQQSNVLMSDVFTRDLRRVHTHSFSNPPISTQEATYPVVIMRPGAGAWTTDFTTLAEDLASHGYIVVGFDAPYRTSVVVLQDGRILRRPPQYNPETLKTEDAERLANRLIVMWSEDAQFVVDGLSHLNSGDPSGRFTGHLNLSRLGAFGHSFGGATALQFCHDDSRCKAGIDIDGQLFGSVVADGITQPFMFLVSSRGDFAVRDEDQEIFTRINSVYDRLPNGRLFIALRGTNHFSFGDQALLKSQYVMRVLQPLDTRRAIEVTRAYVRTFFDVYLKGAPVTTLQDLNGRYPEVQPLP
jgi:predicted dienelactone hydrolase